MLRPQSSRKLWLFAQHVPRSTHAAARTVARALSTVAPAYTAPSSSTVLVARRKYHATPPAGFAGGASNKPPSESSSASGGSSNIVVSTAKAVVTSVVDMVRNPRATWNYIKHEAQVR